MKRQENRAVLAWRGAASAGLDSSADRAYMKAPVPRPTLQLVDKVSRSCGHTPGKVAGQRATVKAEMNGFTPGLDLRPLSRWMGGQGGQSSEVLGRPLSDFGAFLFSKLKWAGSHFRAFPAVFAIEKTIVNLHLYLFYKLRRASLFHFCVFLCL